MEKDYLILKSAPASRPGEWSDDDYDVLSDGSYVGRIFKAAASPIGMPWMWTILVFEDGENYMLTHGYAASREGAMAAFRQELAAGMTTENCELKKSPGRAGAFSE